MKKILIQDELKILLDELVNFYSKCNTDEIKVNESDCLLDIILNVSQYTEVINQILCIHQAFIVYIVNSWSSPSSDAECCEQLQRLFAKYNNIVVAVMASDKTNKKKDKGNKKNKAETTGTTTKFIEPAIHLDFDVLYKCLSLLMESSDRNSVTTVAILKRNVRFWEFVLKLVKTHLSEVKNLLSRDIKPLNLYENLCKLTKLLYDYFLFDFTEKMRFSQTVVEAGLNCYLQAIQLVSSYYKKLDKFLSDSNHEDLNDQSDEIFTVLRNFRSHLDKVLEMNQVDVSDEDDDEDKETYHKIECHLIECVSVICHFIKNNHDPKVKNVLIWLCSIAEKFSFSNLNNSKEFLTLMLEMHTANEEDSIKLATAIKNLCYSFGQMNKQVAQNRKSQLMPLKVIIEWNRAMVCLVLCQCLCNELNYVLLCLSRIKAELNASQKKIKILCQDRLKAREKAICHRIVLVILAANTFTKTVIPLGQCTESVFNLLYQVYRTVNTVTKYFLSRSSYHEPIYKQALLGKLSQIVNDQLSPNVFKFIMFVKHDRP